MLVLFESECAVHQLNPLLFIIVLTIQVPGFPLMGITVIIFRQVTINIAICSASGEL
jgi:hypothetical protein